MRFNFYWNPDESPYPEEKDRFEELEQHFDAHLWGIDPKLLEQMPWLQRTEEDPNLPRLNPVIECGKCGLIKECFKGLCKKCYQKQYRSALIICEGCNEQKRRFTKNLCRNCYIKGREKVICVNCGQLKAKFLKGLCQHCYHSQIGICIDCRRQKKLRARGLCHTCYKKSQNLL
jgi:hypothetical protein